MYDSILASRSGLAFALIVLACSASRSSAQIKPRKVLDSHLSLDELVVRGIYLRQRGGKKYLYLVTSGKPGIMLVNVTKAKKPFVMKEVDLPKDVRVESLDLIGMAWP